MYANYHKAVLLSRSLVWGERVNSGSNSAEQALPSLLAEFPWEKSCSIRVCQRLWGGVSLGDKGTFAGLCTGRLTLDWGQSYSPLTCRSDFGTRGQRLLGTDCLPHWKLLIKTFRETTSSQLRCFCCRYFVCLFGFLCLLTSHEVVFLKPPFVIPHSGHRVKKKRDRKDGTGKGLKERRKTELLLLWEEDLVICL